ncbi:C40 family peptidase [Aldersonia kunmingensis]|uniref:C40 family peptidase n=1 Tax=Aldersonia kunmingensis TaxID=408066 RepID=UPI00082BA123|nr:C40 family peptidase [Aldersonia kunmingensis]
MGKHSVQRESRVSTPVRGAIVLGAVTAGAVIAPAAPAMAATINVPGLGDINVPDLPTQQLDELQALADLPQVKQLAELPQVQEIAKLPQVQAFTGQLPQVAPPTLPGIPDIMHSVGQRALEAAKTKVGAQYVWGATGPNSFDCSGLVQWAYKQAGVNIPRTSFEQANAGIPIPVEQLQPGDIVISNGGNHASVYAGNGNILEASTSGVPVKYTPISEIAVYTARRV